MVWVCETSWCSSLIEIRRCAIRVLLLITIPTAAQTPTPVPSARYAVYRTARTSIQAVGVGPGCVACVGVLVDAGVWSHRAPTSPCSHGVRSPQHDRAAGKAHITHWKERNHGRDGLYE
jgi:hypothetical protein